MPRFGLVELFDFKHFGVGAVERRGDLFADHAQRNRWPVCQFGSNRARIDHHLRIIDDAGNQPDAERLEATYAAGVLTLHIPVAEAAKPRKVPIAAGTDARTIEAQTTPAKT